MTGIHDKLVGIAGSSCLYSPVLAPGTQKRGYARANRWPAAYGDDIDGI